MTNSGIVLNFNPVISNSRSSLYYWAHYDFFNNTSIGERIPHTACDETFTSWRSRRGNLRSPLNTLIYKHTPTNEDVSCLYRFITDKRLYTRVIVTIQGIFFKEHPYNTGPCGHCYEDRVDKLLVWEPIPIGGNASSPPVEVHAALQTGIAQCFCKDEGMFPKTIISRGEQLNLQLIVDNAHAATSYFKHPNALFKAKYDFVHGPLCGPAIVKPATEGEIHFPYYEALGYVEPPKDIHCIWDLEVNKGRDLWLHFERIKFASKHCDEGKVIIYLPGRTEPHLIICGENVSVAQHLPIFAASELVNIETLDADQIIQIHFIAQYSATRNAFKIAYTELYHLPRNEDGTLMQSRLTEGVVDFDHKVEGCEFPCPGETGLCIPSQLVCNGIINCPKSNASLEMHDESPTLCLRTETEYINW